MAKAKAATESKSSKATTKKTKAKVEEEPVVVDDEAEAEAEEVGKKKKSAKRKKPDTEAAAQAADVTADIAAGDVAASPPAFDQSLSFQWTGLPKKEKLPIVQQVTTFLTEQKVKLPADEVKLRMDVTNALTTAEKDEDGKVLAKDILAAMLEKFGSLDSGAKKAKTETERKKSESIVEANQSLVDHFNELGDHFFKIGDKGRGCAYKKVASTVAEMEEEMTTAPKPGAIKGVGKSSCSKIQEFLETGKIQALEDIRNQY